MFAKILIANRGEIAVRIARTALRMGVATVAVYADPDQGAPHVTACDEAVALGGATASESYLLADKLIAAAERTGAEAIHPGYGFLSENADFAAAVEAAGLVFIGPAPETIRAMGSKSAAKRLMAAAGVPTTPGYHGQDQSLETFTAQCAEIGYPVLLKAAAGGGGKGMRVVESEKDLKTALAAVKREGAASFGDDEILAEKYVARARHLEVQVFGDGEGGVVHLFERDCSVQRRHQKIIEEAPAPRLPPKVRATLLQAGVDAAKAVNYRGAGTVEFLYDGADGVYFMEMNTRLQVEHPVTEMITGVDLVEWQLRVAAGAPLPLAQDAITETGHAFEARIYAENPDQDFGPSIGTLHTLDLPDDDVRVDAGVTQGQAIPPHYDPMIAKLITHAPSRGQALGKLRAALANTRIAGVETNVRFLRRLASDPDFHASDVSTRYISEHRDALFMTVQPDNRVWAIAALYTRTAHALTGSTTAWRGFRLNAPREELYWVQINGEITLLRLREDAAGAFTLVCERQATAAVRRELRDDDARAAPYSFDFNGEATSDGAFRITVDEQHCTARVADHGAPRSVRIWIGAEHWDVAFPDVLGGLKTNASTVGGLTARLPGVVTLTPVKAGETVAAGTTLMVLEAMKMEHAIHAPSDGMVRKVRFHPGDTVKDGDLLVDFEPT